MWQRRKVCIRRVLLRVMALGFGLIVAILGVEASLRLAPQLFSSDFLHWAFSRYDTLPGGMYVRERMTRMRFMRADFETRTFSPGYWWTHRTDHLGFRNPPDLEQRNVLLFGDSFIYGHGVEEHHTVAHFLRANHGVGAYNMASTGQCLYEHYVLSRLFLDELQPDTVVLFVFHNDFRDLEKKLKPKQMAQRREIRRYDYPEIRRRVRELQSRRPPLLARGFFELGTARVTAKWLNRQRELARRSDTKPEATPTSRPKTRTVSTPTAVKRPPPERPTPVAPSPHRRRAEIDRNLRTLGLWPQRVEAAVLDPDRCRPIADYYRRILRDMSERCEQQETRLVVVQLFLLSKSQGVAHARAQRQVRQLLRTMAARNNVDFYDTEALFKNSPSSFLPGDGHLSLKGHKRLARFLVETVGVSDT